MSKERLEEIKQDVKMTRKDLAVSPSNEMTLHMEVMLNSMDYLIARVRELEEKYYNLKESAYETQMDFLDANKYRNIYKEQNKRYRERLEYMLEEAKDHKKKGLRIQHWALIKDLEQTLEDEE